MRKIVLTSLLALSTTVAQLWALAPMSEDTLAIYSNAAKRVAAKIPQRHLQKEKIDDDLAENAVDILLESLDYDHTFFLQSDVDRFKQESGKLDGQLKRGNLEFAFDVYETFMRRLSNRVDYVDQLLEEGFDLNKEEKYTWKREDLGWPGSKEEWNDVWRKKIKNMYVGHLVSEELDEEEAAKGGGKDEDSEEQGDRSEEQQQSDAEDTRAESGQSGEQSDGDSLLAETPEESIRNQYDQLLSVMNDNDAHWLLTLYLTAFTRALDPHSDYMSQRGIEDFNISMKKALEGIGALLRSEDGAAKIVRLIPGGPAERDGRLKPNDKIIAVGQGDDGEMVDIRHWPLSRAVRKIRGEKGSKVVLSIIPASDVTGTKVKKITLVRDEVKLEEQVAKGRVEDVDSIDDDKYRIGVITIPDFYADMEALRKGDRDARSVTKDVRRILEGFQSTNHVDGIVLDLRNNGGGALSEAVDLTGLFIESGPVVQVKTSSWFPKKLYDTDPAQVYKGPLVVLVNRLSASAAEILAAALQDYDRAVVVGDTKTHGKGTVQALLPLSDDDKKLGSLKLTTAGFYRIAGKSTQLKGVNPDIVIPSVLDYMEVGEEHQPHALKLSAIKPAFYWEDGELDELLPRLRERSQKHRKTNDQFQEYIRLVEHIGNRRQSEVVSLNLEDRVKSAREERRMQDLAMEMDVTETALDADADAEEDAEEDERDLVLKQALQVAADLVDLENSGDPESGDAAAVAQQE